MINKTKKKEYHYPTALYLAIAPFWVIFMFGLLLALSVVAVISSIAINFYEVFQENKNV